MNDVTVQAAVEAIMKGEIKFTLTTHVYLEQNSLSGYLVDTAR